MASQRITRQIYSSNDLIMKLTHWIIIGLCVVIALLLLFDKDPEDDNGPLIAKIKTRDAAIHEMSREHTVYRTQMRQDSIILVEKVDSVSKKNVVLTSNIKRLRATPRVIEIVKENPVIDTIFQHYDSLLISKDFIIYSQEKQINQLYVDINEIERNFEHRLGLQAQSLEDYRTLSDEYKKDLRKERRKKRLASVLVPIVAVGAFLAGTSL